MMKKLLKNFYNYYLIQMKNFYHIKILNQLLN